MMQRKFLRFGVLTLLLLGLMCFWEFRRETKVTSIHDCQRQSSHGGDTDRMSSTSSHSSDSDASLPQAMEDLYQRAEQEFSLNKRKANNEINNLGRNLLKKLRTAYRANSELRHQNFMLNSAIEGRERIIADLETLLQQKTDELVWVRAQLQMETDAHQQTKNQLELRERQIDEMREYLAPQDSYRTCSELIEDKYILNKAVDAKNTIIQEREKVVERLERDNREKTAKIALLEAELKNERETNEKNKAKTQV